MRALEVTFQNWKEEIARMWRLSKNNGITEGFHGKMKLIQCRAYGFRNFENDRLRVIARLRFKVPAQTHHPIQQKLPKLNQPPPISWLGLKNFGTRRVPKVERVTRLERATSSLARKCSTS
ncbi:MAG: hypothetical protein RLZZ399_2960 [Verrucomicrobiota bacterium]